MLRAVASGTSTGGSGTGDVVGPASSTLNAVARYADTSGKLLADSVGILGDTGKFALSGAANSIQFGTDFSGTITGAGIAPVFATADLSIYYNSTRQAAFNGGGLYLLSNSVGLVLGATSDRSLTRTATGVDFNSPVGITSGTITTSSKPALDVTQTWNDGAVVFTGAKINVTNTASAAGSLLLDVQVGGVTAFNVSRTGGITFPGNLQMGAGGNPQATLTGGTVTASTPVLNITQTWNSGAVTFNAMTIAITNTASASASAFLDMTVGGTSFYNFARGGKLLASGITARGGSPNFELSNDSSGTLYFGSGGGGRICFGSSMYSSEAVLQRDGANGVIGQYSGTQAQVFRIYRTRTDASNYERQGLQSGAGYFEWVAETAGTGTDDIDLRLTPSSTTAAVDFRNPTNGAAAGAGTITNAPSAGNPAYWLKIKIAGTTHYIPAWT